MFAGRNGREVKATKNRRRTAVSGFLVGGFCRFYTAALHSSAAPKFFSWLNRDAVCALLFSVITHSPGTALVRMGNLVIRSGVSHCGQAPVDGSCRFALLPYMALPSEGTKGSFRAKARTDFRRFSFLHIVGFRPVGVGVTKLVLGAHARTPAASSTWRTAPTARST